MIGPGGVCVIGEAAGAHDSSLLREGHLSAVPLTQKASRDSASYTQPDQASDRDGTSTLSFILGTVKSPRQDPGPLHAISPFYAALADSA